MGIKKLHWLHDYQVIQHICDYKGVSIRALKSKSRLQRVVFARMLVAYLYLYEGRKLRVIANMINRDHSAVSHYKDSFLHGFDKLAEDNVRGLRVYMIDKGILVPSIVQFKEKFNPRNNNK